MMPFMYWGDYLPKDQAEECIFVYFFVLFVHVTVCLFQVLNNIVHTRKARCSLFVLKVKGNGYI